MQNPSRKHTPHTTLMAALILAVMLAAFPALAQETAKAIDLPQQALQKSLAMTGEAFGLTVVAPSDLVRGKTAPAVSGTLTPEQTMELLLAGSGLNARHSANGSITITKKNEPAPRTTTRPRLRRTLPRTRPRDCAWTPWWSPVNAPNAPSTRPHRPPRSSPA